MNPAHSVELARWLAESGLAGKSEAALLEGFCRKVNALGIPLARATVIIDTLHPIHEGRAFRWRREAGPDQTAKPVR